MDFTYLLGLGVLPQILLAAIICILIYLGMLTFDSFVRMYRRMGGSRFELMPHTYSSETKSYQIKQNPNLPDAKPVTMSDNELTGIEFSYSFYINVNKNNFNGSEGLRHVFHKGNVGMFPLMGPAVFMHSEKNIMRVYMNSYETWNNYCDIDNIPVGKWVHIALIYKNNALEIYINGNLSKKISFTNTVPYQNYGDYFFFSMNKLLLNTSNNFSCIKQANDGNVMDITGPFSGLLSKVIYYNYGISYSEIQKSIEDGPSTKVDAAEMGGTPPYLTDNWWVQ